MKFSIGLILLFGSFCLTAQNNVGIGTTTTNTLVKLDASAL